jgi:hypothetical protein
MVILAPGTTAPVRSVTVPTMLPVEIDVCPGTRTEYKKNAKKSRTNKQLDCRATREINDDDIVHSPFR